MAQKIFSRDHWPVARKLSAIVYCNPFVETRWQLERECLGGDYRERASYVAPDEPEALLAPNLPRLLEMAIEILEAARARLARGGEIDERERAVYVDLVHFVVYHEFMGRFDVLIERALAGKPGSSEVKFYFEYRDRQRRFLGAHPATRFAPDKEALYFALYYQLRRAWVNIYRCIVGGSDAISQLRARIWNSCFTHDMNRYQRSLYDRMGDIVTLVTGPSGTGKELVARAVGLSRFVPFDPVAGRFAVDVASAFYPLNLSALSPTLIESELFGHRKGAFTGALQDREGYFEDCGPFGTVFLDEIGETDPAVQVKLLRVLQTRQFQRLGDTQLRPFVGKVMAATNRDLAEEIGKGSFREDFYYRLCSDRIRTPSLCEVLRSGKNELEVLVKHISLRVAGPLDGPALMEEACAWINRNLGLGYEWPGNVRELEQCVRNILIHGAYEAETRASANGSTGRQLAPALQAGLTANQLLSSYAQALYREHGSYEETARILQTDRRTAKRYVLGVE